MISRLPSWIAIGGFTLACNAGMANAIGLLGLDHQSLSHLSGISSMLGSSLSSGDGTIALHLASLITSFVFGALCSGMLINHTALRLDRNYATVLTVEAAAFAGASLLMSSHPASGSMLALFACGAQNAMATSYSGSILRTTHVTGIFTDIGVYLGQWLRGARPEPRRLRIYLSIVLGFCCGGAIGSQLFHWWAWRGLLVCSGVCVCLATVLLAKLHWDERQTPT